MRMMYVKTKILGMACINDASISMRAKGTVEIEGKITSWEANFTITWNVKFERTLENEKAVGKGIANVLGHVELPLERTFTYERR